MAFFSNCLIFRPGRASEGTTSYEALALAPRILVSATSVATSSGIPRTDSAIIGPAAVTSGLDGGGPRSSRHVHLPASTLRP